MYTAYILMKSGRRFDFSYENGVLFDIKPLTGNSVKVSTSQGFQQIGDTVEGTSVSGVKRVISGTILREEKAKEIISVVTPLSSGSLYVNDNRCCDFVVSRTPELRKDKRGVYLFTMQVHCEFPFWQDPTTVQYLVNGYIPSFSFPVLYDSHDFGKKTIGGFTNCINSGDVDIPLDCTFFAVDTVTNYGLINVETQEKIVFEDVLNAGEKVSVKRASGRVVAQKTTAGGTVGVLAKLTDDSTLLTLRTGDNVFKAIADENDEHLRVYVNVRPGFLGVIV